MWGSDSESYAVCLMPGQTSIKISIRLTSSYYYYWYELGLLKVRGLAREVLLLVNKIVKILLGLYKPLLKICLV